MERLGKKPIKRNVTKLHIGALQDRALSKEGELPLYHVEPYNTAWMYMGNCIRGNSRPLNLQIPYRTVQDWELVDIHITHSS